MCSAASGIERIDAAERAGIERALGRARTIAAPKAIYGETFGASGALGIATAVAWLTGTPVEPRVSGTAGNGDVHTAIVIAVGYYGNVSAVVLRSYPPKNV